jgi:hypothetical protein
MSLYAGLVTEDDIDYADDFRDAVWADMRGTADDEQAAMLHDNPVGWFRELRAIKRAMNASIAEGRTRVRAAPGDEGKHARSEQYARRANKFHVITKAEERRQYVIRLVGNEGLTTATVGVIVDDIARSLDTMRDGTKDEAVAELHDLMRRLMRQQPVTP